MSRNVINIGVVCFLGLMTLGCSREGDYEKAVTASEPEITTSPIVPAATNEDISQTYADIVLQSMRSDGVCASFTQSIRSIGDSSAPSDVRMSQIDNVIDKADKYGCINY